MLFRSEITSASDVLIAEGEDEITDEIEKITGLNGEIFTSAIYIRQGEIDRLLSATPSVRKGIIGTLLGAEDLENAHKHMRDLIDYYKIKIGAMQNVHDEISKVKDAIEKEKGAVLDLKSELLDVGERLDKRKKSQSELKKTIGFLELLKDLENELERNTQKRGMFSEKIDEITRYEEILKETESDNKRYHRIEEDISKVKDKIAVLLKYQELEIRLKEDLEKDKKTLEKMHGFITNSMELANKILNKEISNFEELERLTIKRIKETDIKLNKIIDKKDDLSSRIGKMGGKVEELERSVMELKTADDKCPVCKAKLTLTHKSDLLKDYTKKLKDTEVNIEELKRIIRECRGELSRLEQFKKNLEEINLEVIKSNFNEHSEIEMVIKKIGIEIENNRKYLMESESLKTELEEKRAEKEELKERNELYIGARQFLRKNQLEKEDYKDRIKELENDIDSCQTKIQKLHDKMRESPHLGFELGTLKKEIGNLDLEVTRLEKAKSAAESVIIEKERRIIILREDQKELRQKKLKLKKLMDFQVILEKIRRFFHKDVLQKELRVRSKPLVEKYTREVFEEFDLPYLDISLTEDFDLIVYDLLGDQSSEMLSGGERITSALALRIGIAKALSGSAMELIILDEPTTHLDAVRRRDLVEIIKRLSSIPQTLIVTHDKEFENAADTLIEIEKNEGVSRVKYAE